MLVKMAKGSKRLVIWKAYGSTTAKIIRKKTMLPTWTGRRLRNSITSARTKTFNERQKIWQIIEADTNDVEKPWNELNTSMTTLSNENLKLKMKKEWVTIEIANGVVTKTNEVTKR